MNLPTKRHISPTSTGSDHHLSAAILTCNGQARSLAQDSSVLVLGEALVEAFVRLPLRVPRLWYEQGAVGQKLRVFALRQPGSVLQPPDGDRGLPVGLTVQDGGVLW